MPVRDVELFCEHCRRPFTAHYVKAGEAESECPTCSNVVQIPPAAPSGEAAPLYKAMMKVARWADDNPMTAREIGVKALLAALRAEAAPARPPVLPLSPGLYAALDPGIRDIVQRLREAGFETVDSGDGVSKPPEGRVVPFAHVFARVEDRAQLLAEADRMAQLLGPAWAVEASYDTAQEAALLMARPADAYDRADGGQTLIVTPEELEQRYSRGRADALRALAGAIRKALAPESFRSLLVVLRAARGAEAAAVLEHGEALLSEAAAQPNPKSEPIAQPEEAGLPAGASFLMAPPAAFAVRNAEIEPILRELGDRIGGRLPEGWGFALFLVSYGEDGELFYISSAEREGMATAIRGWLARQVQ
jgi:hypothetical protein